MKSRTKQYLKSVIPTQSIIVEAGAHYGEDSTGFLRSLNPRTLFCFEPDPRNIHIFRKHVSDPIIKLVEKAVSSKNEQKVPFYLNYKDSFGTKMFDKYHWIDRKEYVGMKLNASGASSLKGVIDSTLDIVKVETIRLDTWAKKNSINMVEFIWIDVQGAEREVVESFGNLSIKRVWLEFGETSYEGFMTREETIRLLSSKTYKLNEEHSDTGPKGDLLFEK